MFASRIKFLRQSKELSQVQLAEKLGVKKQSVSNWENNNIMPSVDMLVKIADFFQVSADYLLGREPVESDSIRFLDVTGLTSHQIEHICFVIDDLRNNSQ